MPSTYTPALRLEQQASGENDTTWGQRLNDTILLLENAIAGATVINMVDADYTLSANAGQADEARAPILWIQGAMTVQRSVIVPAVAKFYMVRNGANQDISIKTANGNGVLIKAGTSGIAACNGTDMFSASSPTAAGSIGPDKIDTSDAAWRLGSALGIGIAQALVPNYGVVHVNGTTGSRTTYSVGGAAKGEINAVSTGIDVAAAPGGKLTLSTNNVARVTVNNDGTVTISGPISLAGVTAATMSVSGNASIAGALTASGGINGITAANVRTALGFTAVQQGTGGNQNPNVAIRIGASSVSGQGSKVRMSMEGTDLGNIMFEGTQGIFAPISGSAGFEWSSNAPGVGFGNAVMIREVNRAGAQGGNLSYAPALSLHWSGQAASSIRLRPDAIISFVNNPGTAHESIMAGNGYFTGNVVAFYSDMRLKTKLRDLDNLRERVRKLAAFIYEENDLAKSLGYNTDGEQLGLPAGVVEECFPWCVHLAAFDTEHVNGKPVSKSGKNYKTVDYARLSSVLFNVVNAQYDRLDDMERRLAALEQK